MLKVLLAGLGVRGRHWAQVIHGSDRAELVACADPSPQALERANAEFGERPGFSSVEAALDALDDVDAVGAGKSALGTRADCPGGDRAKAANADRKAAGAVA